MEILGRLGEVECDRFRPEFFEVLTEFVTIACDFELFGAFALLNHLVKIYCAVPCHGRVSSFDESFLEIVQIVLESNGFGRLSRTMIFIFSESIKAVTHQDGLVFIFLMHSLRVACSSLCLPTWARTLE
jgi:hypothetical protein